jgi:probable F420-dependent oxidoreductase
MPVKIGIIAHATPDAPDFAALARHAEALGFESLWSGEHTVVPVATSTPYRGGEPMPEAMKRLPDPLVALALAAGATKTLRLGTAVCLVPEHDPILLAKQVATIDALSGGRFHFGIGAGWIREETEVMGGDFAHRWRQTREYVAAMKALWTQDEAAFAGEYVNFPALWAWPKPVQRPHPPILIAGALERAAARVADYGDGWIPHANDVDPAAIAAGRARIAALMRDKGRSPDALDVTVWGGKPERALMAEFADAGTTRILFVFGPGKVSETAGRMENLAGKVL